MAKDKMALNEAFRTAVETMIEAKRWEKTRTDWGWLNMRDAVWTVVRDGVLSKYFVPSGKAKKADGTVIPASDEMAYRKLARAAFDKAFDAGYTVEASNCGKHLVDNELATAPVKGQTPSGESYV